MSVVARMARDRSGATALEYGLIIAAIALAIISVVFLIGEDILAVFQTILTVLQTR